MSRTVGNRPLEGAMQQEFDKLGPVLFDDDDAAFANQIRETLTKDDISCKFSTHWVRYTGKFAIM